MAEPLQDNIVQLTGDDVKVGVALPWSTFDKTGRLLLREGAIVTSNNQLNVLLERGMYRQKSPQDADIEPPPPATGQKLNPFITLDELLKRSRALLQSIVAGQAENARQHIEKLCADLNILLDQDTDAALAGMHLDSEGPYSVAHSLYCAMLAGLISRRRDYGQDVRMTLMAAALTSNVGMLDLQEKLVKHDGPLSEETRKEIERHPERSAKLLKAAGIDDGEWLTIVEQHHEKEDGSGYSRGLSGPAIHEGAKIVSVADRYHALISDRAQRSGLAPTESLRKLFVLKEGLDEASVFALIKELGIFPPGVYVRLFNGEIGMVTRRGQDGVSPQVSSLIGPRGAPYNKPFARDCGIAQYAIKEMAEPLSIPVSDLYGMWGYG